MTLDIFSHILRQKRPRNESMVNVSPCLMRVVIVGAINVLHMVHAGHKSNAHDQNEGNYESDVDHVGKKFSNKNKTDEIHKGRVQEGMKHDGTHHGRYHVGHRRTTQRVRGLKVQLREHILKRKKTIGLLCVPSEHPIATFFPFQGQRLLHHFVAPLCLHHFVCTSLFAPLCLHHFVCTTLFAPLCCTALFAKTQKMDPLLERCSTDPLFKGSPRMCFLKTALENTPTKDAFQQLPLGILFKLFKSHGWENVDCPVTTTRDEGLGSRVSSHRNVFSKFGGP